MAFSKNINNPLAKAFQKKNKIATLIFMAVLFAIALVAIFIFAADDLETALITWAGVVALIIVLSLFSGRSGKKTWDGELEDKRIVVKTIRDNDDEMRTENIPTLFFRTMSRKKEKVELTNGGPIFDYYNIGDKVRKHPGFTYPEKHDKDETIICIFCGNLFDIKHDNCPKCKLIAMK